MTWILDPIGTGTLGSAAPGRGTPKTLISSVQIIGQPSQDQCLARFVFDHDIDAGSADTSKVRVNGSDYPSAIVDSGPNFITILNEIVNAPDVTTWSLEDGHGITSPGRTVPAGQGGNVNNLKTLVTSVVYEGGGIHTWSFDNEITVEGDDEAFKVDAVSGESFEQSGDNGFTASWAFGGTGWEITAVPTNVASPGRYIPLQSGAVQ